MRHARTKPGKILVRLCAQAAGWTNELIRDLLPAPHSFPSDGHPIRVWSKEDVRQAERSPQFTGRGMDARAQNSTHAPTTEGKRVCSALTQAWDRAGKNSGLPWLLAGHYHSAILARLPAAAKRKGLRPSQGNSLAQRVFSSGAAM